MVRVCSGLFKGRILKTTSTIKPTSGRIKEALFSIIGGSIINCKFLDLYAGTGSIGIEALSRGAEEVVFVESDFRVSKILKENLANLRLEEKSARVLNTTAQEALSWLGDKFSIVFLDPPYCHTDLAAVISKIPLQKEKMVIVQHSRKLVLLEKIGELSLTKQKVYGNSLLSIYEVLNK